MEIEENKKEVAEELKMLGRIPSLTSKESTIETTPETMVQEKQTHFKENRKQVITQKIRDLIETNIIKWKDSNPLTQGKL